MKINPDTSLRAVAEGVEGMRVGTERVGWATSRYFTGLDAAPGTELRTQMVERLGEVLPEVLRDLRMKELIR